MAARAHVVCNMQPSCNHRRCIVVHTWRTFVLIYSVALQFLREEALHALAALVAAPGGAAMLLEQPASLITLEASSASN